MAKSNWGITSGFIGKLGNVVGFNWKGQNLQRALIKGADRHSEAQQLQRARFAAAGRLASILYEALYEGFRYEAHKLRSTQSGLFVKYNLAALSGDTPDAITVDCTALQLSYGKMPGVVCGTPSLNGTTLSVSVSNTVMANHRTSMADRVYLCAYSPALDDAVCACVGTRVGGDLTLTVPAEYASETVHVYAFVIGASSTNEGLASKTSYLGTANNGGSEDNGNGSTSGDSNSGNTETGGTEPGGNSGNSGNNGGSSNGSSTGSETETVEAPTINGTTPFEETTQVSISGPAESEIRYTTDGSTPTAESTLYSGAFTLSDTTTVKAIAVKNGTSSSVTTKTFTKGATGGASETE